MSNSYSNIHSNNNLNFKQKHASEHENE